MLRLSNAITKMKYEDALNIIDPRPDIEDTGDYAVTFECQEGSVLRSDHFPDLHAGEKPIVGLKSAWQHAKKFAACTDDSIVNVYVIHALGKNRFSPVKGYDAQLLKRYSPGAREQTQYSRT